MKYKVIALSVGGKGRKIYDSGDIVTADCFPDNNADILVEKGFLAPYVEPVAQEAPVADPPPPPSDPPVIDPETKTDEPVKDPEPPAATTDEPVKKEETTEPQAGTEPTAGDEGKPKVKTVDEFTVATLKAELKALNVPFQANAPKAELYKLWADLQ